MTELGVDEVTAKALRLLRKEPARKKPKILMIRLDRLGDLMLSLPAIQAVREYFPDSHISVMTRPSTAGILEGHPLIDEVIPYFYEKKGRHSSLLGNFRFLLEISRRRFDICFILHPSVRSYLVPFVTGIPYRVGFSSALSFTLTRNVKDLRHLGLRHESEYTLDIVRSFGINDPSDKPAGVRFFSEHQKKVKIAQGRKVVAIHPGSSCPSKKWPVERYAELIKMILRDTPHAVAVVGGGEEKVLGEVLKKEDPERVLDLTGTLNLKELAAFFTECEVLISNDSGPVHVAAAAGTPTLVIFGRNKAGLNRERWRPLGEAHRTMQKNIGCAVCLADACTIDFECLKAVSAEEVHKLYLEMARERAEASKRP
jgi:heptosyltransferase-2